jgi:hypothetical protein
MVRILFSAGSLAALAFVLSGCMTGGPGRAPLAAAPTGVEGDWLDPNGIRLNFNAGVFESRTTDTNQKLSDGSYRYQNPQLVEIQARSLVRGTTSTVNCGLVSQNQMNCTGSGGQQFVLTRRPAVG